MKNVWYSDLSTVDGNKPLRPIDIYVITNERFFLFYVITDIGRVEKYSYSSVQYKI